MTTAVRIQLNGCTEHDIRRHLVACETEFDPPLSQRVDIAAYAQKIRQRALTVEAWQGDVLVGLVAAYLDDRQRTCFVTNVSVLPKLKRRGIASALLSELLNQAGKQGMTELMLEVSKTSKHAAALYARFHFTVVDDRGATVLMKRWLAQDEGTSRMHQRGAQ